MTKIRRKIRRKNACDDCNALVICVVVSVASNQ